MKSIISPEEARQYIKSLEKEEVKELPIDMDYQLAASVLYWFDPEQLSPFNINSSKTILEKKGWQNFLRFCDPVYNSPGGNLWQLRIVVRRNALVRLHEGQKIIQALEANENRGSYEGQRLYESVLRNEQIPIDDMPRPSLVLLSSILNWVSGILPYATEMTQRINRAIPVADLLLPMHRLANENFVGRKNELAKLAQYVGIIPTETSAIQAASRFITELFVSIDKNPPFLIYGPGGVGKSTLLAKFILDNASKGDSQPLPFAYLDIDKSVIELDWPESFVMEASRQLATQCPAQSESFTGLAEELERHRWSFDSKEISKSYKEPATYAIPNFGYIVRQIQSPVMLVIDTFEEAQFLGEDVVDVVWDLLANLQKEAHNLRIVIAGRSPVRKPVNELHLTELSKDESRELLEKELTKLEMPAADRAKIADEIINIVGLNPMSLRLALTIVKAQGIDKLKKVETKTLLFVRVKEEVIQSRLYGRILAHIHDEEVKKLAYPGLIVRRIDPEIILSVLSVPCKLAITTIQAAEELCEKLSAETSLMSQEDNSNFLVHRADVRKLMLADLKSKVPAETIRAIHDQAVKFYENKDDLVSRTEEIYHRLSRVDDPKVINSRWMDGVESGLRSALEELGTDARIWLSGKLKVTPDSSLIKKAGLEKWEEITVMKVQRYLTSGKADKALELMRERTERSQHSPIYRLELETLRVLGLYEEASFVAEEALAAVSGTATPELTSVLLLQASLIKEGQENIDAALQYIKETEKLLADPPTDILEALRVYVTHIRLLRKKGQTEDKDRSLLLQKLISLIATKGSENITLDDIVNKNKVMIVEPSILSSLRSNPALLQELVAESGKLIPELLDNAIDWIGIDVQSERQKDLLANALKNWNTELRTVSRRDIGELVERSGINEDSKKGWLKYVTGNTGKKLTRNIQHWRKEISKNNFKNETTVNFDKALVDLYRNNVDMSINKNLTGG